jgi:hypothetical protein
MIRTLSRNALLVVAGAMLVSACASVEDVQRAQATADEALARSDRAMGTAQTALGEAQSAQQAAAAARAEAQNASRQADEARAAAERPLPQIVARGERG